MSKRQRIRLLLGSFGFMLVAAVLWPVFASDQVNLYLNPGSRTVAPGSTFNVQVRIDTGAHNMQFVRANMTFPADKLQVASISTSAEFNSGSSPGYDNNAGQISISRLANPAKSGDLLVATVTFNATRAGNAAVRFENSSIAVDDRYRDQLKSTSHGSYTIANPSPPPAAPPAIPPSPPPSSSPAPQPSPPPASSPSPSPSPGTPSPSPASPQPFPDFNFNDDLGIDEFVFDLPPVEETANEPILNAPGKLKITDMSVSPFSFTSVELKWKTNIPSTSRLEFGGDELAAEKTIEDTKPKTDHRLVVEDLMPGKIYFYALFLSAGEERADARGDFMPFGLPVKISILSGDGQPAEDSTVTVGAVSFNTDSEGNAYFGLPAGDTVALVEYNSDSYEFPFTVIEQPLHDNGRDIQEQTFTFTLSKGGVPLWLLLTGLIASGAGGFLGYKRFKENKDERATRAKYTVAVDEPPDEPETELTPLPVAPQDDDSPLVNPTVIQPGSVAYQPPAQTPVPVNPPPIPALPLLNSETDRQVGQTTKAAEQKPEWQADLQDRMAQAHPQDEKTDEPKDMFELADEQASQNTTKHRPAEPKTINPAPPEPEHPEPGKSRTHKAPAKPGHHIPDWQAELQQEIIKKIPHDNYEEPQDMFDTAEAQYHYDEKLKKPKP